MRYLLLLTLLLIATENIAQELTEKYQQQSVELITDENFAIDNNWDKIFESYYDTTFYGKAIGKRKSLFVLDDGSIIVNNIYRNYYTKFDKYGKFENELFIKKADNSIVKKTTPIMGIINSTYYTNADNMGNILCFDFSGNYIKTIKVQYSVKQIITLNNNKIALVGWSIWKDKFRDFVAIIDYNTNEESIIWSHFTERKDSKKSMFNYKYNLKKGNRKPFDKGQIISINTMPYTKYTGYSIPPIIQSINNKLIIAIPASGEIITYNFDGKQINKIKINWAKNHLSIDEQKKIQKRAMEKYKQFLNHKISNGATIEESNLAINTILNEMQEDYNSISKPLAIPVFSTIIKDSDNNLLFFEISKKSNDNKFNVWIMKNNGEFASRSSFICKDYNLEINPKKIFFHNGYIYSLQTKKNASGNPLRLVKFRLQ